METAFATRAPFPFREGRSSLPGVFPVRHALVRAPVDPASRQRAIVELARMLTAYVRDRFV